MLFDLLWCVCDFVVEVLYDMCWYDVVVCSVDLLCVVGIDDFEWWLL